MQPLTWDDHCLPVCYLGSWMWTSLKRKRGRERERESSGSQDNENTSVKLSSWEATVELRSGIDQGNGRRNIKSFKDSVSQSSSSSETWKSGALTCTAPTGSSSESPALFETAHAQWRRTDETMSKRQLFGDDRADETMSPLCSVLMERVKRIHICISPELPSSTCVTWWK